MDRFQAFIAFNITFIMYQSFLTAFNVTFTALNTTFIVLKT